MPPVPPAPLTPLKDSPDTREPSAIAFEVHDPAFDPVLSPWVIQDLVDGCPIQSGLDHDD